MAEWNRLIRTRRPWASRRRYLKVNSVTFRNRRIEDSIRFAQSIEERKQRAQTTRTQMKLKELSMQIVEHFDSAKLDVLPVDLRREITDRKLRRVVTFPYQCECCGNGILGPGISPKTKVRPLYIRGPRPLYNITVHPPYIGPEARVEYIYGVKHARSTVKDPYFKKQHYVMALACDSERQLDQKIQHQFLYTKTHVYVANDHPIVQNGQTVGMIVISYAPSFQDIGRFAKNPYIDLFPDVYWVPHHQFMLPKFYAMNPYI